ncbi:MAG TPA: hypothetical protein VJR47_20510 [Stellaceae bacterium]|nr:hypothetical protein [Stellaceae bacterium]
MRSKLKHRPQCKLRPFFRAIARPRSDGIVEEFLVANHVHYDRAGARREMSTLDIADKARKFTVRVECR